MRHGAQFVMTLGMLMMPELLVELWASRDLVIYTNLCVAL